MKIIRVDNYIIEEPIENILDKLKYTHFNGKLSEIRINYNDIAVTCPCDDHSGGHEFHPDCHINLDDATSVPYGTVHCFACGFASNFIGFVAQYFSSSYDFAKQWLIENFGIKAEDSVLIDNEIIVPQNNACHGLDESVLNQYQNWTPYLDKRKLRRDICERFKVKYDPYLRQVIFPVYDIYGHLKMLARRSIDTKFFHMDESQDKEVYCLNEIQKNNINFAIITEGPFDTLSGWNAGIPTIGTLGEISDYQIAQINKSCLTCMYTMFDNDKAGAKFTNRIMNKVSKRILVNQISFPKQYKDINELPNEQLQKIFSEAIKN